MPYEEDTLAKDWMTRIDLAEKAKETLASTSNWPLYKEMYRNNWSEVEEQEAILNVIYSTGKTLIPRIYFRTPTVTVTPRRPEFAGHARIVEAVDNYLLRELSVKRQLKRVALDTYLCGTGIVKLGYDSEFGFIPEQSVDIDTSTVTQTSRKTGELLEYNTNVSPGMPWALRVRPEEILVPFGYDSPEDLPWICHTILRPLKDVKEDVKYIRSVTSKLIGGYTPTIRERKHFPRMEDYSLFKNNEEYCLIYEIRDLRTGRIYAFSEGYTILDEVDGLQLDGLPFEFLIFNENPDNFWGLPDVKYVSTQQKELNEIKVTTSKMRRYNILKFLYRAGVIEKDDLDRLFSDSIEDIGAGIPVSDEALQSAVLPLIPHNLTQDLERDKQMVLSDLRETIGISRNEMGEYIPMTSKTATEASIVNQASDIRLDERRDAMADMLVSIVRKVNQIIFKYWTKERVVEIVGPSGAREWVSYTGDQLKGEYFLSIDPDSGVPVSKRLRYEQSFKLLEAFRGDPYVDQLALRKIILNQFEWIDPTATLIAIDPTANMSPPGAQSPNPPPGASTPENPINFEQMTKMLTSRMKGGM